MYELTIEQLKQAYPKEERVYAKIEELQHKWKAPKIQAYWFRGTGRNKKKVFGLCVYDSANDQHAPSRDVWLQFEVGKNARSRESRIEQILSRGD